MATVPDLWYEKHWMEKKLLKAMLFLNYKMAYKVKNKNLNTYANTYMNEDTELPLSDPASLLKVDRVI